MLKIRISYKTTILLGVSLLGCILSWSIYSSKISSTRAATGQALGKIAVVVQNHQHTEDPIYSLPELIDAITTSKENITPCFIRNGKIYDSYGEELVFDFQGGDKEVIPFVATKAHIQNNYTSVQSSYGR